MHDVYAHRTICRINVNRTTNSLHVCDNNDYMARSLGCFSGIWYAKNIAYNDYIKHRQWHTLLEYEHVCRRASEQATLFMTHCYHVLTSNA